ncbi:MAG TPA: hypothetical protein VL294_10545 [Pseudolysinimonas sp.]|jgi:hypothetical protein|nr:hypothetical protein [Pseudolysinimonas sp.]
MRVTRLAPTAVRDIEVSLSALASEHGLTNVFNPSPVFDGKTVHLAFRAESTPGERPFRAYYARFVDGVATEFVELSKVREKFSLLRVADPKLVKLGPEVYATFNSGHVHGAENDIYLQRVAPTAGPPQRCRFPGRARIEKNWGFFLTPDGDLAVMYRLSPLKVLEHVDGKLGTNDDLTFDEPGYVASSAHFPSVHIGSQPLPLPDGRLLVMANRVFPVKVIGRFYAGRLAIVDPTAREIDWLGNAFFIHRFREMLPLPRTRPNPNLLACTYFSGLTTDGDDLVTAYGVNDLDFGIARIPARDLPPNMKVADA